MEAADITPLLEQLDENIDDLADVLAPLLKGALSDTAAKLPLLDKAKLYVLVTYAIESVLFSFLRLNGVNAKDHPVFRELTRVKQYFEKIKHAEFGDAKRENLKLNKPAAGRIVKRALAGNDRYDLKRAEQQFKKNSPAHIRFEQIPSERKADETASLAADADEVSSSTSESESSDDSRLAATKPPQDSVKEHVVSGLEQASSVDRGSMVGLVHQHAGKMEKCESENLSSAERYLEESLRPKDTERALRPTRKPRVEKREREARERAGEPLNQHD